MSTCNAKRSTKTRVSLPIEPTEAEIRARYSPDTARMLITFFRLPPEHRPIFARMLGGLTEKTKRSVRLAEGMRKINERGPEFLERMNSLMDKLRVPMRYARVTEYQKPKEIRP